MKKMIIVASVLLVIGLMWHGKKTDKSKPVIAILQIASHAALDASREAFVREIQTKTDNAYTIVVKNADGSIANAQAIAQSLVSRNDVVAYYAIGTPALQALVQKEQKRPILYAAVSYPEKLGLIADNVAGASDYFDLHDLIEYAHTLMPGAKRVGIVYNPGTEIAQYELSVLEAACKKYGLSSVRIAGVTEGDILAALKSNLRKIDLCVVPTDNMIASVLSSLVACCKQEKIPVIAAWQTALSDGATAACGMNYTELGHAVGVAAVQVLQGLKTPADIGIIRPKIQGLTNPAMVKECVEKDNS